MVLSTKRIGIYLFFSIIAIGALAYFSFMAVYYYTSTPEYCESCHYIKPYVASWRESPHKEVNCLDCHELQGPVGKLQSKSRGINYYLMDLSKSYVKEMIRAEYISERNCFVCHISDTPDYKDAPKLTLENHQEIKDFPMVGTCSSCHQDVGHLTSIGVRDLLE